MSKIFDAIQIGGIPDLKGGQRITTLMYDPRGDILFATGITVPTDSKPGFAKGCLFIDTDIGTGTTGLYCNKGTRLSCVFTAVTQA
jgi:hypothetical protein